MLKGTPAWVYAIFVYLMFIGLKATQRRTMYLPALFIIPVILLSLRLYNVESADITSYFSFLALGGLIGMVLAWNTKLEMHKKTFSITLPGTWQTLFLLLAVFTVKYFFGYQQAISEEFNPSLHYWSLISSATITGIFWGKSLFYAYKYYSA